MGAARCQWSVNARASGSHVTLANFHANLTTAPAGSVGSAPQSRGQERNGAPTVAQQAHAVTDELILAAVHATGGPEPLRGLSCHSTGAAAGAAHGPAQTTARPRLLRFIRGRGDDREAGDVSTAPTPQRTNELAKSRGATATRPILF